MTQCENCFYFQVVKGEARGILSPGETTVVAVKMLKDGHSEQDLVEFIKEMHVMKVIGSHPNIINLLGVCTQPAGQPLFLVVEYAALGNLKDYLVERRPYSLPPTPSSGVSSLWGQL